MTDQTTNDDLLHPTNDDLLRRWEQVAEEYGNTFPFIVSAQTGEGVIEAVYIGGELSDFDRACVGVIANSGNPPCEWVGFAGPVIVALIPPGEEPDEDLDTRYLAGAEDTSMTVNTIVVTDDSLQMQMYTQPLCEPLLDEPLEGGEGFVPNALRFLYELLNGRIDQ